jgi:hypothetical protein
MIREAKKAFLRENETFPRKKRTFPRVNDMFPDESWMSSLESETAPLETNTSKPSTKMFFQRKNRFSASMFGSRLPTPSSRQSTSGSRVAMHLSPRAT